jgi:hypothetical protein
MTWETLLSRPLPPDLRPFFLCCLQVVSELTVPLYNSTSVLDDMAWGGVWLYLATDDPAYLGKAQRYLGRHYTVRFC